MTDDPTGAAKGPLDELGELSAEHSRLVEEKRLAVESGLTPRTTTNFELTKLVKQMTEIARAQREVGDDRGERARSLLRAEAAGDGLGAGDALELLADEDPWWGES